MNSNFFEYRPPFGNIVRQGNLCPLAYTIEICFLILISRSFKKGTSDNTISYFDQSFWFSGQNKPWGTENRERTNDFLKKIFNSDNRRCFLTNLNISRRFCGRCLCA